MWLTRLAPVMVPRVPTWAHRLNGLDVQSALEHAMVAAARVVQGLGSRGLEG